jgi:uncharacterized protein YjiS (DUF1127 family)
MSTNISDQHALGKFGALLFARSTPLVAAERHPSLLAQFKAWRSRQAALAELSGLSDRELADIGLTRQEIPTAVQRGR